ncbi:MAG: F0F1 ATP synthase subunit gamma [Candidatus Omnitrophica bacterium]|jgi:ATP synthase F1 gamma subunit|nr:F0F1 ATP synthase subunit gamma [Candidatus Omnitrophota bacterium]
MSKTKKLKIDYDDTAEILDLILILKDIATTLFQKSAKSKQILIDFVTYFTDFFKMASFFGTDHPLVHPKSNATAILVVSSESAFMGDMNSRLIRSMQAEADKNNANDIIVLGNKAGEKIKAVLGKTKKVHVVTDIHKNGNYKTSINTKDYIINEVMEGRIGKIVAVYPFAININLIRPKVAVLFPSTEAFPVDNKEEPKEESIEHVVVESDKNDILGYLASLWLTCRIYELLMNCECSGFAAQVQQLESAGDRLKKEKLLLGVAVKKSRKSDISKSLAEVFASRMVNTKSA